MSPEQIIQAARLALETPFRHQGRLVGIALDCAGLIVHVAQSIGAEVRDQGGYAQLPGGGLLESALDDQPCLVRVSDMQAGDVLLMRFAGDPQHLGIYTGESLIHAYQPIGKVCEHLLSPEWARRIVRVYRFRGMTDGQ